MPISAEAGLFPAAVTFKVAYLDTFIVFGKEFQVLASINSKSSKVYYVVPLVNVCRLPYLNVFNKGYLPEVSYHITIVFFGSIFLLYNLFVIYHKFNIIT